MKLNSTAMSTKLKGYSFYVDFGIDEKFMTKTLLKTNSIKRSWTRKKLQECNKHFNCIAIYNEVSRESLLYTGNYEGACAIFYHDNSDVCTTGISPEYLRINCTRISQELARKLHPKLIEYLEYEG